MKIQSGSGDSYFAQVDSENRLYVIADSKEFDRHVNEEGRYWTLFSDAVTATGANDYFIYLKNTGITDLVITDIRASSTVATRLTYEYVSGSPTYSGGSGTAISPINNKLGNAQLPTMTANSNVDITGLTSEGTVAFEDIDTTAKIYHLRKSSGIIIPQGKAFAIKRVAATGAVTTMISLSAAD